MQGHKMRSNPGDLPQELQHRPQNCPSVTIHLNEGISLMVGMGGGARLLGHSLDLGT